MLNLTSRTLKRRFPIIVATLLAVSGCTLQHKQKQFNPSAVAFDVSYNATFDNVLYPSMVLALANYSGLEPQSLFTVSLVAPTNNAVLRVVMDSSNLNYVTILQEVMPRKGERYYFEQPVKWKYDYLYTLRQQGAADLTFTCYINDEEVDIKNLRINYRTVNECPLSLLDTSGHVLDYRWLFSAYVNEDHPYIDSILTTILSQGIVNSFSGYQKGANEVRNQVFAVWYYALNRGITYSSISCTSNPSRRASVQHIRFFDEVYLTRQANCVDACVFFASILRKIGLEPVIFVEPCHAYLGYYTDKERKKIALLETTVTGWVNLPQLEASRDKSTGRVSDAALKNVSKYVESNVMELYKQGRVSWDALKISIARSLFQRATDYDNDQFSQNKQHFENPDESTYQMLVVSDLRKVVQPIKR